MLRPGALQGKGLFGLDKTGASDVRVVSDKGQFLCNVLRREHVIDGAGGDGAAGHAVVFRGVFILGKSDAALRLNFGHAECAVRASAGENDADGAIAFGFGERTHEMIDGHVDAVRLFARRELESVVSDGHGGVGRNDVDVIELQRACRR